MSVIKIFSTQRIDKNCDYIRNEIFVPIRCGAVYDSNCSEIPGDNTGENISEKRMTYCELTTQYWAWKNIDADYYGFGHYRRYFAFKYEKAALDDWGTLTTAYLDDESIKKYGLCPENLQDIVEKYDIITPIPTNLQRVNIRNVREQYKMGPHLHIEDLDIVLQIINEEFPQYSEAARRYINGTEQYLCNMFILRKDLFIDYSTWLFAILNEFERRADMSLYSEEGKRTPGHLGERLFGIYATYLKMQGIYKVGEFPICNIEMPEKQQPIRKAYDGDSVSIVFSSSEYFAPYCGTTIQSVIRNADPARCYDIVILEQELSKKSKKRITRLAEGRENISIRTYNVKRIFQRYQLHICEHFSVETYFRLVIPELFDSYEKVLYLDSDLIAQTDVGQLFDIDVTNYAIAAALDVVGVGLVTGFSREKADYYKKRVRLKNFCEQLNGGVMLLNLSEIRRQYTAEELLKFAALSNFDLADQDVFNSLFQGQIKWIDLSWNAADDEDGTLRAYVAAFAPSEDYKKYKEALEAPKIIHYAGTIKPWHDPNYQLAEEFWSVLRETSFYDIVMYRRIIENADAYSKNAARAGTARKRQGKRTQGILRSIADVFAPKGTMRREAVKKFAFAIIGKEYVTPYYMLSKEK